MAAPVLEVRQLAAGYGAALVLHDLDITVGEGEFVAIVGANGAGKSTLLRTISGLLAPRRGEIRVDGKPLAPESPQQVAALGIAHVPEGRRVFADQSTEDNLWLGAWQRLRRDPRAAVAADVEAMFERFPNLRERRHSHAGLLSGGEQQMLAIGRALIGKPRLLMLDEPSLGLAPTIVAQVFELLEAERAKGTTILLVEQLAYAALRAADRGYVLEQGRVVREGGGRALLADPDVRAAYLGGARG